MKLVTKYLICYETAPSGSWVNFLTSRNELDTEEEAVEILKKILATIREQYYIIQVKRFEK